GAACINGGATYTATVTPNTDYLLSQNDFLITMNGVDLTPSTNFTYVGTILTIPNVTGNLVIVAIAAKDPSKVDCSNYSYAFTAKLATGALTLGTYSWNATITNSAFLGYDATKGAQIGSSTNPAKLVSLTTAYTNDCCVSKVLVNAAIGTGGDAQLAVYLNGTQVGTTSALATTNNTYTFTLTQPTKGNLEVRLTNTVKAVYIKSIAIEYGQCPTTDVENPSQSDVMVVSELNGFRLVNVPSNAQIRIFDMMGRLMLTDNKVEQNEVYDLSSGMYAIQVTSEGKTYTLKAICN
ncbi:MAG: T9SS type A sorting domain-containing protein, partial [Paludibacter sp.]|nr:T9SS type A sorting domain-containing protein [Paludibacter sp.]